MLISEISLLLVFCLALICLKYNKFEKYIVQLLLISSVLTFLDDKSISNEQFLLKNNELIRSILILIGAVFVYINKALKQQVAIICLLNCVNTMILSDNVFSLIISGEFAIFSTYYLLNEKFYSSTFVTTKYFKYNMLASSLMVFFASMLIAYTNAISFDDIRFEFAIFKDQHMKALIVVIPMILAFFMRVGFCGECLREIIERVHYEKAAPTFCLLIPCNFIVLYHLMSNVFRCNILNDVLSLTSCISIICSALMFYKSKKISTLISSVISFFAGIIFLCCSMLNQYSDRGVLILSVSYVLLISALFLLLVAIRKKFNYPLKNIEDFFSIGYRYKNIGMALSLLLLCFIGVPPSFGFDGNFCLYFSMIFQGSFVKILSVTISFVLIVIKSISIISNIWLKNNDIFFDVVNKKLTNIVYVIIIIDMIILPLVCGVFGCNDAGI